jgi:glucokinase
VNVATVAEHQLGAGKGASDVLGVFVGTGVGGGMVLGGQLRRGKEGYAGEIGHIVIRQGGRRCGCQGLGHLEAYAGRGAMEEIARDRAAHGTRTVLVELAGEGRMTSSVFAAALEQGDPVVVELLDDAVSALGAGIGSAVTLLDVEVVVVGGGLADRLGPAFVGRVEQAAREQLFASASRLRVVPAALGDQAGALGAALITKA